MSEHDRAYSPVVKRADEVAQHKVRAGKATTSRILIGPDDGAPHFALRRFTMGEGGGMPRHTNRVEHEQYVLRGRARVGVGEKVYEVSRNDVLLIPAGTPHFYEVIEAPFEFLCIVPNEKDEIQILDEAQH